MDTFTTKLTEELMIRIEKMPVDDQIREVKRALKEDQTAEIIGSLAFTAWLEMHKERIVELAQLDGWPS